MWVNNWLSGTLDQIGDFDNLPLEEYRPPLNGSLVWAHSLGRSPPNPGSCESELLLGLAVWMYRHPDEVEQLQAQWERAAQESEARYERSSEWNRRRQEREDAWTKLVHRTQERLVRRKLTEQQAIARYWEDWRNEID